MSDIKVEEPIEKALIDFEAIRVYDTTTKLELALTAERGEEVKVFIKTTARKKGEIEIVFLGSPRREELFYYKKDPAQWTSWGNLVLTAPQARKLVEFIKSTKLYEGK